VEETQGLVPLIIAHHTQYANPNRKTSPIMRLVEINVPLVEDTKKGNYFSLYH